MGNTSRAIIWALSFSALAAAEAGAADAGFPSKALRIIVPFAPGGNVDINARTIAPGLGEALGQSVLVENRPGASGQIGAEAVAKSAPDGHTLMLVSSTVMSIVPAVYAKLRYDILKDFAPVGRLAEVPFVIVVHPSVPAKTTREFIALAKARPRDLRMATGGLGTSSHLVAELFAMSAGIRLLIVPYKGGGPALTDLIGGHVDTRIDQISSSVPHIKSGKVRAIATTTVQRVALLPGVPTLAESGMPGFEASVVTGLLAPAGTPPEIVRRLNAALVKVLSDPVVVERFASLAAVVRPSTSEELARFIREDLARWRKVVRETGIKIE